MKIILDHKYLSIQALTHEHADAIPGGNEPGDIHHKRTKVDISIKGSINPDGLDSILSVITPIAMRGITGVSTEHHNTPKRPAVVDCEEELAQDLLDLADAAAHDLGMSDSEFLKMVSNAVEKTWPLPMHGNGSNHEDHAREPASPPSVV